MMDVVRTAGGLEQRSIELVEQSSLWEQKDIPVQETPWDQLSEEILGP
jgi:hypothetical protein